ncbi:hypothetical protein BN2475_1180016 [Paraburkholderia ribeironis]|uniref:Uncharacterized protein n=1 Tax=Paraburkholderia ribeironis TaxID=1247936 RepID=A0A1N7SPQ9_9BURK|nr:hypothetical protein BN2475_1180016 [Paraburkholderia ribeironis]
MRLWFVSSFAVEFEIRPPFLLIVEYQRAHRLNNGARLTARHLFRVDWKLRVARPRRRSGFFDGPNIDTIGGTLTHTKRSIG